MTDKVFKFKGKVVRAIYKSDNFSVYAMDVNKTDYPDIKQNKYNNVGICGELYDLIADVEYEIEAIEQDTKYGTSYKVIKIKRDEPTTIEETLEIKEVKLSTISALIFSTTPINSLLLPIITKNCSI